MKSKYVSRDTSNRRLILLFAGWGMDSRMFRNLSFEGYDILVLWDYRDLTFSWKPLMRYDEICLIAWSMGVFAASLTIHEIEHRITKRIAVSGTLDPINDRRGIPTAIYHGTINALNPATLRKFYRRMCTSAEQFAAFRLNGPKRSVAELIEELTAIETHTIFHTPQIDQWDLAVIGRHDQIFPVANQLAAWRPGGTPTHITECGHLPDFPDLISRLIIDKKRVESRFSSCGDTYGQASLAQQKIAGTLIQLFTRAAALDREATPLKGDILEIGCGNGTFTRLYTDKIHPRSRLRLWDIADVDTSAFAPSALFTRCDAEVAIRRLPSKSTAYILSASTIQWFNSPASFIRECERVLVPGGYLVLSAFVNTNLSELTQCADIGLNLPAASTWQAMIPDSFSLFVCQASAYTLHFDSPRQVLEHLRHTGVNAVSSKRSLVTVARRILENYPRDEQGRCPLTYRPIFIIARRNDPGEKN